LDRSEEFFVSVPSALRTRAGLLFVSAGAVLWGTTGVAVRIIAERSHLAAVSIGFYRVLIAALVLALAFRGPGLRLAAATLRRHPVRLAACGAGFGAYQALYFVGVQFVGVSVSTLVSLGVAPVALTVLNALGRRRRPTGAALTVLACALTGLALVCVRPGSGTDAPHPVWGVLASIASGLGYAGITLLSHRMADEEPLVLTGVTSFIGALVLVPFALVAGLAAPVDAASGWWLLYVGVVPTIVAYWFFYSGLRTTPSDVAGVLSLLEPLTAAVVAAVVLHESLGGSALVGGALMLVAVAALYLRTPAAEVSEVPPP
jgi:DME family drug/metabolite transporter